MTDILIGRNDSASVSLDPHYGNRHGMIAGATGTGKSVSLMVLAEGFSRLGVPCFLADAKGDLAGLAMAAADAGDDAAAGSSWGGAVHDALFDTKRRQGMIETTGKQMVRTAGSQLGRQIMRGVLGGIFRGKR
jgi:hypothetical protein